MPEVETHCSIYAQVDKSKPISILSTPIFHDLQIVYEPCPEGQVQDARNHSYTIIGKVDLDWIVWQGAMQWSETFYVVRSDVAMVMLGQSAFREDYKEPDDECYVIELPQKTPGDTIRQVVKNSEHNADVSEQTKRQEEHERIRNQLQQTYHDTGKCPTCGRPK
ncbi:MAG: hypothetical protein Q9182_006105 [Xanthomendoza sp. 2 TL-2023]